MSRPPGATEGTAPDLLTPEGADAFWREIDAWLEARPVDAAVVSMEAAIADIPGLVREMWADGGALPLQLQEIRTEYTAVPIGRITLSPEQVEEIRERIAERHAESVRAIRDFWNPPTPRRNHAPEEEA